MSINDPQWGNSHRPEPEAPDQAPENTGAAPVQPDSTGRESETSIPPASPNLKTGSHSDGQGSRPSAPPPEGPPDLEELWQNLVYGIRCRIAALLRRPAPPKPVPIHNNPPASELDVTAGTDSVPVWQALSWQSWFIGVGLLLVAWLISGFYLVDASQRGVVSRFGAVSATVDPGWHWRLPYPFESVRLVNVVNDRTLEVSITATGRQGAGLMLTSDQQLVEVSYALVYQVTDPVAYLTQLEGPTDLLATISEGAMRQAVGLQTLSLLKETLTKSGDHQTSNTGFVGLKAQIQGVLDNLQAGIVVKELQLRELQQPSQVLQAIKQSTQDEQARIRSFREAQAAATESLVKAYKIAQQLEKESIGYSQALDAAGRRLRSTPPAADLAQSELSALNQSMRQQYPLVFDDYTGLMRKAGILKPTALLPAKGVPDSQAQPAATAGDWRDREIMRNRDRVDRPGSGS